MSCYLTSGFKQEKRHKQSWLQVPIIIGAPGPIRTADNLVRSQGLYPAELRAQNNYCKVAVTVT